MSRCFPFPPPGYEKKARIDDTDLLTKEKHKEKKHKKSKKHKEKREDKDRKDKERSKEKHREKKHRNEKDKDKEKEGNKAKSRTSDDNRVEGQTAFSEEQRASSSGVQNNEIKDSKFVQELAKRIRDDSGVSPSQMVPKIAAASQKRAEPVGMSLNSNVGNQYKEKEKIKRNGADYWKANGQRNITCPNEVEKPFAQNFIGVDKLRAEDVAKQAAKKIGEKPTEGKEKKKHRESKGDKLRDKDRKSKNKERDKEKRTEERMKEEREPGKDQILKESKSSSDSRNVKTSDLLKLSSTTFGSEGTFGKHKELEDEMLQEPGPRYKEIDTCPLDFRNIKTSNSSKSSSTTFSIEGTLGKPQDIEDQILKESVPQLKEREKDPLDFRIVKSSDASSNVTFNNGEGTRGKRKELEVNGHMLDNGHRPSKLPRCLSSSDSVIQNGRKSEPFQATVQLASEKQEAASSHGVDIEEQKTNGLITVQQSDSCLVRPPSANVPAAVSKETVKSPHPDAKYLDQIFSIPEGVDLPDFFNQDWLFSGTQQSKKPRRDSPEVDGIKQVWAEALLIESAEVSALPYVIPY